MLPSALAAGYRLLNAADVFFQSNSTFNTSGDYAFRIEDTHGMNGSITIASNEINSNTQGGIFVNQHPGSNTIILGGDIQKNSNKNVGVYSDILAGQYVGVEGIVIDNVFIDPPNNPLNTGNFVSKYNLACVAAVSYQFEVTAGTRISSSPNTIQPGCRGNVDFDGRDAVSGLPLMAVDPVLDGEQTGAQTGVLVNAFGNAWTVPHGTNTQRADGGATNWQFRGNTASGAYEVTGTSGAYENLALQPVVQTFNSGTVGGTIAATAGLIEVVCGGSPAATSLILPGMGPIAAGQGLYAPFTIKDTCGNAATYPITITTPGAATIDGAASYVINHNKDGVVVEADGTNFFVPQPTVSFLTSSSTILYAQLPVGTAANTVAAGNDGRITGAAPLGSPTFTGTPALTTTPAAQNNSTALASTAYVDRAAPCGLGALATQSLTGGSYTMTAAQLESQVIEFSGVLTSNEVVTFPASPVCAWKIINITTGAFTLTAKITGASVTIAQGGSKSVSSDGTTLYSP